MDEQPLYNSKIIRIFVSLLEKKYPQVDVPELLRYAEITPFELSDEGHWLTQRQVDRFHTRMTQMVGSDIAREGGRHAASAGAHGMMMKYTFGLIGPANTLLAIGKCSGHFSRSATYDATKLADNKVEITAVPHEGVEEQPYQCENRIGIFEAVVMLFNYEPPEIEHPECIFQGGECCRYIVSWNKKLYASVRSARNRLLPLALIVYALLQHFWQVGHLVEFLTSLAFFALGTSYFAQRLETREIETALAQVKESTEQVLAQMGVNYNNARMVNEVGQALSRQSGIDQVLDSVIQVIEKRLGYDRAVIMLADARKSRLTFRTGYGYTDAQRDALTNASFDLTATDGRGIFVTCFRNNQSRFVSDFTEVEHLHTPRSLVLSQELEARSFICCPIACDGEVFGILAVDNKKSQRPLMQSDLSLLTGIAPVIGMSLRNAISLERERRMSEQIRQSQKMESVGVLAGGIAHDFNNLLTGMMGFVALAQMNMKRDDPAQGYLEQVLNAAERAASLTQGLLAFSRKQVNHPEPVNLNQVIENLRKLLSRLVTFRITLQFDLWPEKLAVVADSSQIDQVITNLVNNARDAMPDGGTLTIGTGMMEMNDEWIDSRGYGRPGSYAVLTVSDTGTGIDEATRAHVLEPFFTTKEVGKGSGLGLAIVYGIVKQHDGYVEIDSTPGVGTTLNVYLPLLTGAAAAGIPDLTGADAQGEGGRPFNRPGNRPISP
ncbi:GAF domain-containing protein [Geomonas subterranea]|uniref:histidine kinase n=1 Tax=Geomonas subterranea TaxID=2847989 RepID=A0ABX8LBX3_9BACT|nr:ATP-binding protein [Geomonas subterranea]QXE89510.1 GAF domain-containing protein [Geomonas subterranea]QXM08375.1 GAF domain-containing protein [Geomonas subterranea]